MLENSNWNPYRFMRYRIQFSSKKLGLSSEIEDNAWKVLLDGDCTNVESMADLGCSIYAATLLAGKRKSVDEVAEAVGIPGSLLKSRYSEIRESLEKAVEKLFK